MRKILSLAIALAALLAVPATATTEFYHHKDGSATSFFSFEDLGGCIRTDITVYAYQSLTKDGPGAFEATPEMFVNIDRVDWCNLGLSMSAYGSSTDLEILVNNSMTAASLRGRVELYDYVGGTTSPAEVDLQWTGSGPIMISTDSSSVYGPSTRTLARGSSRHREAEVTGVILLSGVDFLAGVSGKGAIYFEQGSLITITRNEAFTTSILPASPPVTGYDIFTYQGGTASASFASTDPTGCITTEIGLGASDSRDRLTPGKFEPTIQLGMYVNRIDWCNSVELMRAYGSDFTGSVQISHALAEATAQGTVRLYDTLQGTYFTVDVDLAWIDVGPLSGRRERLFADFPNYRSMTQEMGRSRAAQASGSILYEGTNLLTGPSQSGSLFVGRGITLTWK